MKEKIVKKRIAIVLCSAIMVMMIASGAGKNLQVARAIEASEESYFITLVYDLNTGMEDGGMKTPATETPEVYISGVSGSVLSISDKYINVSDPQDLDTIKAVSGAVFDLTSPTAVFKEWKLSYQIPNEEQREGITVKLTAQWTPKMNYYVLLPDVNVPEDEITSQPMPNYTYGLPGTLLKFEEITEALGAVVIEDDYAGTIQGYGTNISLSGITETNFALKTTGKLTLASNEIIDWYVVKWEVSDGWHVDGKVITVTPPPVTVTQPPINTSTPTPTEATDTPTPEPTIIIEEPTQPPAGPVDVPTPLPTATPTPELIDIDEPSSPPESGVDVLPQTGTASNNAYYIIGIAIVAFGSILFISDRKKKNFKKD